MSTITLAQKKLIEKIGVFFEGQGRTPVEARIVALFLVGDQLEMTLEDMQQALNISKSSVTNAINVLLLTQQIDYVTRPGDRRKYYKSKIEQWLAHAEGHMEKALQGKALLKEALDQRTASTKGFNSALKELIEFMEFMQTQHQDLFAKWKKHKAALNKNK